MAARRVIQVEVISDAVCPFCFIGKRALEQAIHRLPELDVQVRWSPYQLAPDLAVEKDRTEYLVEKFGAIDRVHRMHEQLDRMGDAYGIHFRWNGKLGNTLRCHQLVELAGQAVYGGGVVQQNQVMDGLFKAIFEQARTPTDLTMLVEVAEQAGLDSEMVRAHLANDAEAAKVRQRIEQSAQRGISGVPYFIFNDSVAVSGAQSVETFQKALQRVAQQD